jgi:hypothetical protein
VGLRRRQSHIAAMSRCACSDGSTRKSPLPREVVEALIGTSGSAGPHVLVAPPNFLDRLLIVLALPFELVVKEFVKTSEI